MKNKILFLYLLLSLGTNCMGGSPIIDLFPIASVDQLPDSSFISTISSMIKTPKRYYFADYKNNRIISLNKNLMNLLTVGVQGKGPGEFLGISQLYFDDERLWTIDDGGRRVNIYNSKLEFQSSFPIPNQVSSRFFMIDDNCYLSTPFEKNPISVFNKDRKLLKSFGKWYDDKKFNRNERHLIINNNMIISVLLTKPIVEIYSLNGVFQYDINFHDNEFVKSRLDYSNKFYKKNKGSRVIVKVFSDAYVENEILYLLLITDGDEKVRSNTVLSIPVDKLKIKKVKAYKLNDAIWVKSIMVDNNKLFGFGHETGRILIYDIDQ